MENKIAQFLSNIRNNLTTNEMKELRTLMDEEIKSSEQFSIREIKKNPIDDEPDEADYIL